MGNHKLTPQNDSVSVQEQESSGLQGPSLSPPPFSLTSSPAQLTESPDQEVESDLEMMGGGDGFTAAGSGDDYLQSGMESMASSSPSAIQRTVGPGSSNPHGQEYLSSDKGMIHNGSNLQNLSNAGQGSEVIQAKFSLNLGGGMDKNPVYQSHDDVKEDRGRFEKIAHELGYDESYYDDLILELGLWANGPDQGTWNADRLVRNFLLDIADHREKSFFLKDVAKKTGLNVDWIPLFHQVIVHIDHVRDFLEEEEELEELEAYETEIRTIGKGLQDLTGQLQDPKIDLDLKAQLPQFIAHEFLQLGQRFQWLKSSYPLSDGGFSAKGRAHAMDTQTVPAMGYVKDDTFLQNITLDGTALTNTKSIYKKGAQVAEAASDASMPASVKKVYDEQGRAAALIKYENELATGLNVPGPFTWSKTPPKRDRNGGQTKNMNNTNASAYAMLANVNGYQGKRWEWLHIRASSLDGPTDGTNLVVGTRDANTQMMPFEANIRALSKLAGEHTDYKHLKVTFGTGAPDASAKHKVPEISIKWELVASDMVEEAEDLSGEAKFNPLSVGSSISKDEIGIIEEALKGKRDNLTPEEEEA